MKLSSNGIILKIVVLVLILLFVISLLFLPLGLSLLTVPEQVFIITLLVLFLVYSKVFGGYYFVSYLLTLIKNGNFDINNVKSKFSRKTLLDYIEKGELLIFVETQLQKINEYSGTITNTVILFLLAIFIVFTGGGIGKNILYSVMFASIIVFMLELFISLYVNSKFVGVFKEEIEDFEKNLEQTK